MVKGDYTVDQVISKAQTLIEALPYIKKFQGKTIVVKYGGSAMLDENLKYNVIEDVALLKLVGLKPVIVHGGGKEISKWVEKIGKEPEIIKLKYFDLALQKWVSKAIVIEDGKEKVTETRHNGDMKPEPVVKVDLKKSKVKNVVVKFEYQIRVENQGQIAGYAKEVSDYIPQGLKFVKDDNQNWREVDGKIVTNQLENTLLQPGESTTISVILTWINDSNNLGLKTNIAEISEDADDHGNPITDIDSTPNNQVDGEDDQDNAPVIITVRTGETTIYTSVIIAVIAIIGAGVYGIKKYVLK